MTRKTYDEKQAAAVLMTCTKCQIQVYATAPTDPYVCILCVRDQERAK
jgi:hypothetical protein